MSVIVRPADDAAVRYVARNLRWEDAREVSTASRKFPEEALFEGHARSRESWIASIEDGPPILLFGVSDDPDRRTGIPWLVGTDRTRLLARTALRLTPEWFARWVRDRYPGGLRNVVDARNTMHVRWLTRIGCRFDDPPVEINKHQFLPFTWRMSANV